MTFQILTSAVGLALIFRNLYLLEIFFPVSDQKRIFISAILLLSILVSLIFKELLALSFIYIGIFSLTLMLKQKIVSFFAKKSFEKSHLYFLDGMILQIKMGKSAKSAFDKVFSRQVQIENNTLGSFQRNYFSELNRIMTCNHDVVGQLGDFRSYLAVQSRLKAKLKKATRPIYVQILVILSVYTGIFWLSFKNFGLSPFSKETFLSLSLLFSGLCVLRRIGGQVKWQI